MSKAAFARILVLVFILLAGVVAIAAKRPRQAAAKPQPTPSLSKVQDGVWVVVNDEAKGCEPGSGKSIEQGAEKLKKANVRILGARKGDDGKMHATVCGGSTSSANAYLIPREDLPQAIAQGFALEKK